MKKLILPLFLLFLIGCLRSTDSGDFEYDNTADIEFLEQNAQREDVTVTNSGLQYRVIEEGDGETPNVNSTVRVHYIGTFINEEIFDRSPENEPRVFTVSNLIQGWTEGLQLMKEGAVYEFVIPSNLAYGDEGWTGPIYPGATLIFEIHLIEIVE